MRVPKNSFASRAGTRAYNSSGDHFPSVQIAGIACVHIVTVWCGLQSALTSLEKIRMPRCCLLPRRVVLSLEKALSWELSEAESTDMSGFVIPHGFRPFDFENITDFIILSVVVSLRVLMSHGRFCLSGVNALDIIE